MTNSLLPSAPTDQGAPARPLDPTLSGSIRKDQDRVWPIDRVRYLRVIWYFANTFAHLFWWDIILRRILGSRFVDRSSNQRWQQLARAIRKHQPSRLER